MIFGWIDSVSEQTVTGWAFSDDADKWVLVTVTLNERIIGISAPQEIRPDVAEVYGCDPAVGFCIHLNEKLTPDDFLLIVVSAQELERNVGLSLPFDQSIQLRKNYSQGSFIEKMQIAGAVVKPPIKRQKAILHIGMHKTGTTSIQNFLSDSASHFFSEIEYAPFDDANHSVPLFSLFANNPYEYQPHLNLGRLSQEIDDYNDSVFKNLTNYLLLNKTKKGTLFSAEDLLFLQENELLNLQHFLSLFYEIVYVIFYIRQPASYFISDLQEQVKFSYKYCQLKNYSLKVVYRQKIEKFFNVFGNDNVLLFDFRKLKQRNVVVDFVYRLTGKIIDKKNLQMTNTSLDARVTQLLFIYKRFAQKIDSRIAESPLACFQKDQKLIYFLTGIFEKCFVKLVASTAMTEEIYNESHNEIQWIKSVCDFEFNEIYTLNKNQFPQKSEVMEINNPLDLLKMKDETYFILCEALGLEKFDKFLQLGDEQKLMQTARLLSEIRQKL